MNHIFMAEEGVFVQARASRFNPPESLVAGNGPPSIAERAEDIVEMIERAGEEEPAEEPEAEPAPEAEEEADWTPWIVGGLALAGAATATVVVVGGLAVAAGRR